MLEISQNALKFAIHWIARIQNVSNHYYWIELFFNHSKKNEENHVLPNFNFTYLNIIKLYSESSNQIMIKLDL